MILASTAHPDCVDYVNDSGGVSWKHNYLNAGLQLANQSFTGKEMFPRYIIKENAK